MEYYIQGNPDKVDQIKDIFVKAGYTLNFNCSDRNMLYFTVKDKKQIHWCGIKTTTADVIKSARESYKEIQLPKFKVDDVLYDTRCSKFSPEEVIAIFPLHGYYRLLSDAEITVDIPFECIHTYFDYYDKREALPFKAGDLVLGRDKDSDIWRVDVFSHTTGRNSYFYCAGHCYRQCIPFKGNESLVGTSQMCCKCYPSWCYGKT